MRRLLSLCLLGLTACSSTPEPPLPASLPETASLTTPGGLKIHALRTGWVGVKRAHRELEAPDFWALPAVLTSGWAPWMPIISYVVEHPEGVFLVDTGPAEAINSPDYYTCDPNNEFFYQLNLRFSLPPGDTLLPRLQSLGLAPERITNVLITHFHADHVGGIGHLPRARFLTGPGNWPAHVGSLTCRLPAGFQPEIVSYAPEPVGLFTRSRALTSDGRVRVVPLPGHTPGHAGLVVLDQGHLWLFAGDATFDTDQTLRGGVTAVSQDLPQARHTQGLLRDLLALGDVTLLPAHDPDVFARLSRQTDARQQDSRLSQD